MRITTKVMSASTLAAAAILVPVKVDTANGGLSVATNEACASGTCRFIDDPAYACVHDQVVLFGWCDPAEFCPDDPAW